MEYDSALTNELRTVVIHSRSVYGQTRLSDFGCIPECKWKNPRGLNAVSLPLARMSHCRKLLTLFNQTLRYIYKCIRILFPSLLFHFISFHFIVIIIIIISFLTLCVHWQCFDVRL